MRVLGYIRRSTEKQEESLQTQETLIDNYSRSVKAERFYCFIDDGIGGAVNIEKRPGLLKLLAEVKKGDQVVVQKRDRIARDLLMCLLIEREITNKGAKLISLAGEGTDVEGPEGIFMRQIFSAFSQLEREFIRQRTRAALKVKRDRGERTGYIPYGQKLSPDGLHLELCQQEQALIKEILKLSESNNYMEIERKLKKRCRVNRAGKSWDDKAISRIVKKFKK